MLGVAISADGTRAVSASADETVKVWDLSTGTNTATLDGHTGGVLGVAISADGTRAVSASDDETVKVWDLATNGVLATFTCDAEVGSVATDAAGRSIVAGDRLGNVHRLTLISGAE